MYKKLLFVCLGIVLILSSISWLYNRPNSETIELANSQTDQQNGINPEFVTAQNTFCYSGKPVHPKMIQLFVPWISDSSIPKVISTDIAAAYDSGRNQFFENYEFRKYDDDKGFYCKMPIPDIENPNEEGWFKYHWRGKLKNGLHVVETEEYTGGRGVDRYLLFLKISVGYGLDEQGKQYEQLLLTIVRVWGGWMHVNEYFKIYLEDNGIRIQFFSIMSDNEDPTSESTITFEE